MTPYFQRDGITIYHADCRDVLPTLEPGSIDLVLTDPPYGVGLTTKTTIQRHGKAGAGGIVSYDDDPDKIRELVREVVPLAISRADRAVIFPGPAMLWAYPEPTAIGGVYSACGTGRSPWGFQCMHPILFYGKDPYLQDGKGSRPNSFSDDRSHYDKYNHPCPKPLKWMRWAVTRASREGETILDPFMGSGTTLRAAMDLGRKAIGIEIEERYCEIAAKRLQQAVLPLMVAD